jgi:hypothetical protein
VTLPIEYQERILLYVDVLGWSHLVAEAEINPSKRQLLARAIDFFISFHGWARVPGIARETRWQVALASDSLFASAPVMGDYWGNFLLETSKLAHSLLVEGIYLRGALVQGMLLHQQELIVGPAVVKAVELERGACFPRILIDDTALPHFLEVPQWIYRGGDGRTSFNFVRHIADSASYASSTMAKEIDRLLQAVNTNAEIHRDCPKLAAKDQWMKSYLEDQRVFSPRSETSR